MEERSSQILYSIRIDSSHHHRSESSRTSVWKKIRTKLPEFREDRVASEVKDRDGEMKAKAEKTRRGIQSIQIWFRVTEY